MADILETLVAVKTIDEVDAEAKFGASSFIVWKVLKVLLMEQMDEEGDAGKSRLHESRRRLLLSRLAAVHRTARSRQ